MKYGANRPSRNRFLKHFPWLGRMVIHYGISFGCALIAGLYAGSISVHYGLGVIILWSGLFSYYLERRFLDWVLIPPFASIMAWECLRLGVGVPLLIYGWGGNYNRELFIMQVAYIVFYPICYAGYRLGSLGIKRMVFPHGNHAFKAAVIRPLVSLGWLLLIMRIIQFTVLAATGAEDRGEFGAATLGEKWGIFTYFSLFPMFTNTGFVLLPLVLSQSKLAGRFILFCLLAYYFALGFTSGTRGNMIYPVVFMGIGWYLFCRLRNVRLDLCMVGVAVVSVPLIVFMGNFRGSEGYQSTKTINISDRFKAGAVFFQEEKSREQSEELRRGKIGGLGTALIGVSDFLIYQKTPREIPHAGFDNFSAIWYTWIPVFFKSDRPILIDPNPIYEAYLSEPTGSGMAMTLTADLYRRFGWTWVPVGLALAWWVYGFCCAMAYKIYLRSNALLGMMLILLVFSFFYSPPFSTVLMSWWILAYFIPKHIIMVLIIYVVLREFTAGKKTRGALSYETEMSISAVSSVAQKE